MTYEITHRIPYGPAPNHNTDAIVQVKIQREKGQKPEFNFRINRWPTGNCQVSSIEQFNAIISSGMNMPEALVMINDLMYQLGVTTRLLLLDVNKDLAHHVENFAKKVLIKENYISSNGSSMTLFLVSRL